MTYQKCYESRKINDLVLGEADIHTKFEYALLEKQEEAKISTSAPKRRQLRKRRDKQSGQN